MEGETDQSIDRGQHVDDDIASQAPMSDATTFARDANRDAMIFARRENGASWLEIQREFDLTRQQARYAYQRGKRVERRPTRRVE